MHKSQNRLTFRELTVIFVCCFGLLILTLATVDIPRDAIDAEQNAASQEAGVRDTQR